LLLFSQIYIKIFIKPTIKFRKGGDTLAFEVVKQILDVEREGEEVVKRAQSEAQNLQNSAKEEAELILKNAAQEAEEYYKSVISKYETQAQQDIAPLEEEGKGARGKFIDVSQDLLDRAVNMVIERIVNSHGNS
jgi:V/A-type H+/Na+-transporting ATPase subunit G/H